MGIFGTSSDVAAINDEIETATSEKNVEEDWGLIMNICDKAGKSSEEAKNYLKAITKRLYNSDPHIGVKAVTLLDACVKNSGKYFHIEIASRDFENDFVKLMNKAHPTTAKKLRDSLKRWAENEFKSDVQLSLIPSLLSKLKSNYDFSTVDAPLKKAAPLSKDPNVVETQEEEEQILKAIELSLKDSGSPRSTSAFSNSSSLYPSVNMSTSVVASSSSGPPKEPKKVRALYDFEAAEDNELTFSTGEIIFVMDDSDQNWWKGSNQRGEGLFPANFVTTDLDVEPEKFLYEKAKKMVQFKETAEVKLMKEEPEEVEINEGNIDRLLHLLHEADPTNPERDPEEMINLEREVNAMGPLIDAELERVDRKHAQLTQLSSDLVEALGLYHTLMREPQFPQINKMGYGYQPVPSPMPFNGSIPPNIHMQMMGPPPGMTQGHDRPPFIHPGGPPPGMPYQHMPPINPGHLPPQGQLPPQMPQMPLHMHQQMMEENRRLEQQMGHYSR
ncbi:hypothetical protein JTB14_030346 [Gonioctena quinquepunctata]|nr:hypothetical protein JTB14_030346 [Gonioctena quinquepunctata]